MAVYTAHFYFLIPMATELCCWESLEPLVAQKERTLGLHPQTISGPLCGDLSLLRARRCDAVVTLSHARQADRTLVAHLYPGK